ncbi:MAG: helix-turn-helix domain-containing protein [Candidatus Woesearchaeota archaeon]
MRTGEILKSLFDEKKISVLQYFIYNQNQSTLSEVVEATNIPLATMHRILKELTEKNLLQIHQVKHIKLYTLAQSEAAQTLAKLFYEHPTPIMEFINKTRSLEGIQQILMHGEATNRRANIVLIGEGINKEIVNTEVANILEKDRFTISHLILEPEQFTMLENMGQFSDKRAVLYKKPMEK